MSIERSKKLHFAFFGSPYEGHVNASIFLVKGLIEQNHKVTYFNTKQFKSIIENSGAIFTEYKFKHERKNIALEITPLTTKEFDEASIEDALEIIPFILKNYPRNSFDAIIYDQYGSLWGQSIAEAYRLPSFGSNSMFFRTVEEVINDLPSFVPLVDQPYLVKLKSFSQYYALHSYQDVLALNNCLKCDSTIIYSSRYLQPNSDNLQEKRFIFFGNRFNDKNYKMINKSLNRNAQIYVSMGTLFNINKNLFNDIINVLKDKPYKIIVSTGNNEEIFGTLKKQSYANVFIYKYVNQLAVLKESSLFISHAGLNSVYESLYHGTPLIMIPQMEEQYRNAVRVQELGGGYLVDLTSAENAQCSIKNALAQIETNWGQYQENIHKIRTSFLQSDDVIYSRT